MYKKMYSKLIFTIFLIITFSNYGVTEVSKEPASSNIPHIKPNIVRIGWVFAMANAPIIIAKNKGYFKQQGVKVVLKSYKSGPLLKKDLMAGNLDMAYIGAPPVYHWFSRGLKSKIIAKVNYGQAAVIVRKDSNITKVRDLRNKRMAGVRVSSGMDVLLRGFVLAEKGNINPDTEINIVTMKPEIMGRAVENKQVSGAFIWEPFTSKYLLRGNVKIILDINKEFPRYPWYIVMATPEAIKFKKPAIIKVLKAHNQSIQFLNSTPNAGDTLIAKSFGLQPIKMADKTYSPTDILAQARKRLGWQARLTRQDSAFIQRLMNYSYELGYIKHKLNVDDLVDVSFMFDAVVY